MPKKELTQDRNLISIADSSHSVSELTHIIVKGAKEHNLKNISVSIPKKKLVVFTGVSGSGKSSLAFDTIYAEGQRRYIESLSSYARQFLGQMEKPKYDSIKGLSPTIAIEQKATSKNPRSTVGTITEVYDYLRVLFARLGTQHCMHCGSEVSGGDIPSIVAQILQLGTGAKILLLAPVVVGRKGEHKELITRLIGQGLTRARVDGVLAELDQLGTLAKHKKHTIEVVVDRLVIADSNEFKKRLTDSVETSASLAEGQIIVVCNQKDYSMSLARSCCGQAYPKLEPSLFSFNSPQGMCSDCNGIGQRLMMDEKKIIVDPHKSIREGAIKPWASYFENKDEKSSAGWGRARLRAMEKEWGLDINCPWSKLPAKLRKRILYGSDDPSHELTLKWSGQKGQGSWKVKDEGLVNRLWRRYEQSSSERVKAKYIEYLSTKSCQLCGGHRLRKDILSVTIQGKGIHHVCQMNIKEALFFVKNLKLAKWQHKIGEEVLKEIASRLGFLENVGLGYLTLDRSGPSLSGGEAQRIRLASQIGSELTGVLYVLDEPSIGLHQRDNHKLLSTLMHLRDLGNSLIVVEHDEDTIAQADWVLDFGPRAGQLGGHIIEAGTAQDLINCQKSLTGQYLSKRLTVGGSKNRAVSKQNGNWLEIIGAKANNLKSIDVAIPCGRFVAITGVSGAGKSTLVNDILFPALANHLHGDNHPVGSYKKLLGLEFVNKVIEIDQQPIGRTPRSNPATYTKLFDLIREWYADLPEAKVRGYRSGRFSFNVKGGRCESCQGDGYIKVEMHFLADVFVECKECNGKRFNDATLEVKFKNHSIADVLQMTVSEAHKLFINQIKMKRILETLISVGLDYILLGQPATTLSGGEAQRIKLARELARKDTGQTIYILDEPTTGLHFDDCNKLLSVLHGLVDQGNTVVVIEHNLDVIKSADWIIDMGPEGGDLGGEVIAEGTPKDVAKCKNSPTGQYLAKVLRN